MNIDTTDSRVSHPKHTAWKKEAWWGRDAASGSSHWKCVRFDDSDENVFSLSFPEPQPQGSCNWLWWVWITSSGRGRPSGVTWHSCAVTWNPPGSWEPGTASPVQRADGSSSRGSPHQALLQIVMCSDLQVLSSTTLPEASAVVSEVREQHWNWENICFASGNWI